MKIRLSTALCAALCLSACQPKAQKPDDPVVSTQADTAHLDAMIQNWIDENNFNGIIAVGRGADTTFILPTGIADHQTGRRLTDDTVFQTGSIDKLFAAIIAFALAEKGSLDLDAPISTYLGDVTLAGAADITLGHLLSNRSGVAAAYRPVMGQMMGGLKKNPDATLVELGLDLSLEEAVGKYGQVALTAEPGKQFDYVYANWVYVHHILESATGQSYGALLDQYVLNPAGATRSGVFDMSLEADEVGHEDIAVGLDVLDDFYTGDFPIPPMLGGGSYTSASDMIRIFDGLYSGKFLTPESLKRFSALTTSDENYAYGGRVMTYKSSPDALYSWQSGSNGATNVVAVHSINSGYSFIGMSNTAYSSDDMFDLSRTVETMVGKKAAQRR